MVITKTLNQIAGDNLTNDAVNMNNNLVTGVNDPRAAPDGNKDAVNL